MIQQTAMQTAKAAGDVAAVATVVGTLMTWLPPIAAAFTIIWTLIRIYETDTVQKWVHGDKCDTCGK